MFGLRVGKAGGAMEPNGTATEAAAGDALAGAGMAVALCCRGDVEKGIALYRQVLDKTGDPAILGRLPVGLHLRLLHDAKREEAAAVLQRLLLSAGLNVSLGASLDKPPAEIADEYRALFARGIGNAKMMADYLVHASSLGDTEEVTSLLDVGRYFRRTTVEVADALSGAAYWTSLAETLLAYCSADNWQEDCRSVRHMHRLRLTGHRDPRLQAVLDVLHEQAARYLEALRKDPGRLEAWIPDDFTLETWALVSPGYGFNLPHIHPKGFATGVLYVSGPDAMGADGYPVGALRIGPPAAVGRREGWPDIGVAPVPGTLVLMPSYFTHWTTPLGKPGLRISIAFDINDRRPA